jgi:rRNA maturation endonuclease Nob1
VSIFLEQSKLLSIQTIQTYNRIRRSEYQARKFETVAPLIIKASESLGEYCSFKQQSFPDLGSVNEQGTEMEDLDEQISDVAMSNPRDDKVETAQQRAKRRRSMLASKNFSQQKLALIVGLRFEWREGKTKLRVLHRVSCTTTFTFKIS